MKNNFEIRKYKSNDYNSILKLWESLDLGKPERGDNKKIIENTIDNGGELLVIEDIGSGDIIGTSWITNDKRRLYLHHFGIRKDFQGKGISKLLLEKSLKFAIETGLQIKLEVHKNNNIALELYKKYDFKYLGDYDIYIIREYNKL